MKKGKQYQFIDLSVCIAAKPCFLSKTIGTHLTGKWKLEKEIEYSIGDPGAQGMLQIHLIAFDDIVWVLGPPPCHHPANRTYKSYNAHPILLVMLHWSPFKPITLFIKLIPLKHLKCGLWNNTVSKVKFSLQYAVKAQRETRSRAPLSPNFGTRCGWMVNAMPQLFYPQEESRYLFQQAGWAPEPVWMGFGQEKSVAPARYRILDCPAHSEPLYRSAGKSLAQPGRKQATATEDFDFHISYLWS